MGRYAVVAIGYNRPLGMKRLLETLEKADYEDDDVTLIVSIDNSGESGVEDCARAFSWTHGAKRIVTYPQRLGLRSHILKCGDFLQDYDAVAVFEDDLIAAPGFYSYMKAAVAKYAADDRIAGISLYSRHWNTNVGKPFDPSPSAYDVYFWQHAESWGQIWMKKQWADFVGWYGENGDNKVDSEELPEFVCSWPDTSWLKYHIKYCVETNKYFVCPYVSLTTCYSDPGQHTPYQTSYLHVPMLYGVKRDYRLPDLSDGDVVVYDVFFERDLGRVAKLDAYDDICVDLYGSKRNHQRYRYILSMDGLPYRVIRSFGLQMRPHEDNVIYGVEGKEIYLYDRTQTDTGKPRKKDGAEEFRYRFRIYGPIKQLVCCVWEQILSRCKLKWKKKKD